MTACHCRTVNRPQYRFFYHKESCSIHISYQQTDNTKCENWIFLLGWEPLLKYVKLDTWTSWPIAIALTLFSNCLICPQYVSSVLTVKWELFLQLVTIWLSCCMTVQESNCLSLWLWGETADRIDLWHIKCLCV